MVSILGMLRLLLFEMCLTFVSWCRAEIFTAISDMEPLLETHKRIIDDLDIYVDKEEQSLLTLKKHLYFYKKEYDEAMLNIPNYIGNPISAFTLIKRLTTDLYVIKDSKHMGTVFIKKIITNQEDVKYPTAEDLTGAAQALTRLQETYKLRVEELAAGVLNGVLYSTPMTAGDCYEVGRALYNEKDIRNALAWMIEAYKKYEAEKHKDTLHFNDIDIMEYIGYSYYLLGDTKSGLRWTYKLLQLDPQHPRAIGNLPQFKKVIAEDELKEKKRQPEEIGDSKQDTQVNQPTPENAEEAHKGMLKHFLEREKKNYEALCRREMDVGADISKRLKCWYASDNHPFLKYAPFKVEQLYITPNIYIFHEVLSDNEIEVIKSIAKPRFKRAPVGDSRTGASYPASRRISKYSWLRDEEHAIVARVSRRVQHMTGLDLRTAEMLQVVNYGIGGHFEPHVDFTGAPDKTVPGAADDRIATVLFYMSEVAQGGATVFTELGLSVFPEKGAAVFWMNLHPSGQGDLATRHAACPVLYGSKWVCSKWIHQGGQELIKPCPLEYQEDGFFRKLPRLVNDSDR